MFEKQGTNLTFYLIPSGLKNLRIRANLLLVTPFARNRARPSSCT